MFIVFFRDPDRNIGNDIVAVADGKIREISNVKDKDIGECIKISTFMNIHNVHVTRMPISGKTLSIDHYKGKHIPAFKKESGKNERVVSIIKTDIGKIKIIQIAGTVARRIVPYFKQNEYIEKGEKIGLIRMGSRVDLYLPTKIVKTITISVNDRLKAGESTVAKLND
jgi:phosphatidylserine decarboxylase